VTLVFDSSTAALWAEEVAEDAGIPVEVVPAPADSAAKCDLALETTPGRLRRLEAALTDQGVAYRRWPA
jgi:Putative Se/S carrier protein-like